MAQTLKCLYQGSPVVIVAPTLGGTITVFSTGGTIPHGVTRYYAVTAIYNSVETLISNVVSTPVTVVGNTDTNQCVLSWAPVIGATGYKVYEGAAAGSLALLATVSGGSTNTYADTGSPTPSGAPPSSTTLIETTATPGLYSPGAGKTALIKHVIVSNPNIYGAQAFLSRVPSGGTGGPANRIISGISAPPDSAAGPTLVDFIVPIGAGEFLTGYVTIPGTVLTIVGVELS